MKKIFGTVIALVLVAALGCIFCFSVPAVKAAGETAAPGASETGTVSPADYTLRIFAQTLTVMPGDSGKVEFTYTGPGTVRVYSSNPQIVVVENGCYRAVAPGTAVITCTDGDRYSQCLVTVTESSPGA